MLSLVAQCSSNRFGGHGWSATTTLSINPLIDQRQRGYNDDDDDDSGSGGGGGDDSASYDDHNSADGILLFIYLSLYICFRYLIIPPSSSPLHFHISMRFRGWIPKGNI